MILLFVACKKDLVSPSVINYRDDLKVKAAQKWFEENQYQNLQSISTKYRLLQPQWDQGFLIDGGIEVSFLIDGKVPMPKINEKDPLGRQRLVLLKKDDGYEMIVTSYLPSKNFTGHLKNLYTGNFGKQKFDGIITLEYLNNNKLLRLEIKQGNIIRKSNYTELNDNTPIQPRCMVERVCVDYYWYQYASVNGVIEPTSWQWNYGYTNCQTYCIGDDDPSIGCPGNPWCPNEDPCSGPNPPPSCSNGNGGGNSIYNPPSGALTSVQILCSGAITQGFIERGVAIGPWQDGSVGNYPNRWLHGFYSSFKDLQVTGIPGLDIPLFDINITAPQNVMLNPETLGNLISNAFTTARGQLLGQPNVSSQAFLTAWSDAFNSLNHHATGQQSTNFHMSYSINQSATIAQANLATAVQNCP